MLRRVETIPALLLGFARMRVRSRSSGKHAMHAVTPTRIQRNSIRLAMNLHNYGKSRMLLMQGKQIVTTIS